MEEKIKRGKILKDLRIKKGLNQEDVAKYLGITQQSYGRYEKGTSEPNADGFAMLAKFYNVSADYLLGINPPPDPFSELGLNERDEEAVLNAYMQLPKEYRACMLEVLRSLAGNISKENSACEDTADLIEDIKRGYVNTANTKQK